MQKYMTLRLFAPHKSKICLTFYPVNPNTTTPTWEDWHDYSTALRVYMEDAEILLLPYFRNIFPCTNPYTKEVQSAFDFCWDNWIGKTDWQQLITQIQSDLSNQSRPHRDFYAYFFLWLSKALQYTDVIVVEGNL